MKIYTKVGDEGNTQLYAGPQVAKDDARIEAYGTVDELSSVLGMARAALDQPELDEVLSQVQNDLFAIGAELATEDPSAKNTNILNLSDVSRLEATIDRLEEELSPLKTFVLPAGSAAAATLHFARTVCRRAERRVVTLHRAIHVSKNLIPYLNRLSDLLFVMARFANLKSGVGDVPWVSPQPG